MKDKDLKEVEALIDMGKKRGYVTFAEMNSSLPAHLISGHDLDDLMIMFSQLEIEVVKAAAKEKEQSRQQEQQQTSEDAGRSSDPVRMYLRKMGTVPLLSREGEIEIAKRIEEGERVVWRSLLTSPYTRRLVIELVEDEEERCQKAIRGGKRPRRTKLKDGRALPDVLDAVEQLVEDRGLSLIHI